MLLWRTGFSGIGIEGGVDVVVAAAGGGSVAAAAAGRQLASSGACSSKYYCELMDSHRAVSSLRNRLLTS